VRTAKEKQFARFLKSSPSANWNASSHKKLLDVVKRVAETNCQVKPGSTRWRDSAAEVMSDASQHLEFLETDVFNVSVDNSVSFRDPLVESWDIDLATFAWESFESETYSGLREEI